MHLLGRRWVSFYRRLWLPVLLAFVVEDNCMLGVWLIRWSRWHLDAQVTMERLRFTAVERKTLRQRFILYLLVDRFPDTSGSSRLY